VKEELDVGKRASERRYRIRTYVVERPVEETVTLRDERVVIERRPVAGERAVGDAALPQEREYEVIEQHEEPVVAKQTRRVEDVVVRKEAEERTEVVRDTVRETKVDVDKEGAERAGNPPSRNP
jgi:stress response protein YsnF